MQVANYLKNRLDVSLFEEEVEQVTDQFARHCLQYNLNPKFVQIDTKTVDAIISRMEAVNPEWTGLPPNQDIWGSEAIEDLRALLRNLKGTQCQSLLERMEAVKRSNAAADQIGEEPVTTQDDSRSGMQTR